MTGPSLGAARSLVHPNGRSAAGSSRTLAVDQAVVLSPFFWNFSPDMWQTTHHISQELAQRYPTLYVEPAPQWNPRSEQFQWSRVLRGIGGRRTRSPLEGLTVLHRRATPLARMAAIRNFDLARNAAAVRKHVAGGRATRLLWASHPYWSRTLIDAIDPTIFVYHSLDHSEHADEVDLIKAADIVFSVSQPLVERHRAVNPRSYLLANGVDLQWFDPAVTARQPRPADLPDSAPIIGFIGSINYHLDIELLDTIATRFSDATLVILGPLMTGESQPSPRQQVALARLRTRSNVRILGFRPPWALAPYVAAMQVCLIPLLEDTFNDARDPMKFYQYLAMGKAIVSSPVPSVLRYREVCYPAATHAEFIDQIARARAERDSDDVRQARYEVAARHSWSRLLSDALSVLASSLEEGGGRRGGRR